MNTIGKVVFGLIVCWISERSLLNTNGKVIFGLIVCWISERFLLNTNDKVVFGRPRSLSPLGINKLLMLYMKESFGPFLEYDQRDFSEAIRFVMTVAFLGKSIT